MPTYVWECGDCGVTTDVVASISARDEVPFERCGGCGSHELRRKMMAPSVMGTAIPDGFQRKDSSYQKLKEAARLDVARASMPHDKRGDIDKEIKSLKKL